MTKQWQEQLERLRALARPLAREFGLQIEAGEGGWAFNPVTRQVKVDRDELERHSPDYCAGLLCHEIGHLLITRYIHFQPVREHQSLVWKLMNAIEDYRVDQWMANRYPGAASWLAVVHTTYGAQMTDPDLPWSLQFISECAREPERDWRPDNGLAQPVQDALAATREARQQYTRLSPPLTEPPLHEHAHINNRYRHEVWPILATEDVGFGFAPTIHEQSIQLAAWDGYCLVRDEILPSWEPLFRTDQKNAETDLRQSPKKRRRVREQLERSGGSEIADQLRALFRGDQAAGSERDRVATELSELIVQVLMVIAQQITPGQRLPDSSLVEAARFIAAQVSASRTCQRPSEPRASKGAIPSEPRQDPDSNYEKWRAQMMPQISELSRRMASILLPQRKLRTESGYSSGSGVDLRALMTYQANPKSLPRFWTRKTLPNRHQTAVALLVDCSGSMQGEKASAAVNGAIIVAETLNRLAIPFMIHGFQDVLIPLSELSQVLTDRDKKQIAQIPLEISGERPGGNNQPSYNDDGPCLMEAATQLADFPATERIMIVISDGYPEGRRSNIDDLHQAVSTIESARTGFKLIGVGIGPDTEHVNEYYRHSVADIGVQAFSAALSRLLETVIVKNAAVTTRGQRSRL